MEAYVGLDVHSKRSVFVDRAAPRGPSDLVQASQLGVFRVEVAVDRLLAGQGGTQGDAHYRRYPHRHAARGRERG
jgi:hypothetical protein